jgi:hypothetical protein
MARRCSVAESMLKDRALRRKNPQPHGCSEGMDAVHRSASAHGLGIPRATVP